jgi:hypothetical protein
VFAANPCSPRTVWRPPRRGSRLGCRHTRPTGNNNQIRAIAARQAGVEMGETREVEMEFLAPCAFLLAIWVVVIWGSSFFGPKTN